MANHQNSSIRVYTSLVSALKAPSHGSPGQRPGFRDRSVRPARAQESSALAGRKRHLGHVPGALPRAGMLRAVGASTWLSSQSEKPATDRIMKKALDSKCRCDHCSVSLQADTVCASTCPPEGGRYKKLIAATHQRKRGPVRRENIRTDFPSAAKTILVQQDNSARQGKRRTERELVRGPQIGARINRGRTKQQREIAARRVGQLRVGVEGMRVLRTIRFPVGEIVGGAAPTKWR